MNVTFSFFLNVSLTSYLTRLSYVPLHANVFRDYFVRGQTWKQAKIDHGFG